MNSDKLKLIRTSLDALYFEAMDLEDQLEEINAEITELLEYEDELMEQAERSWADGMFFY